MPRSRDRLPDRPLIDRTVRLLSAAGFTVCVALDDTLRPAAQVAVCRRRGAGETWVMGPGGSAIPAPAQRPPDPE